MEEEGGGGGDKNCLFVSACFGVRIVGDTVFFSLNIQSHGRLR